ncbi:MAG TPA: choice-of-anchor D domain-containing protein [Myxococcota bacterium]|nr:choice-of-anchor D domain-containing protein [Myxococcota bacterium]
MRICWGEVGMPMSTCAPDLISHIPNLRDDFQFPDLEYSIEIQNLRPSTWYHYVITDLDYIESSSARYELSSDSYFRTAPLSLEDQVEIITFSDFGPATGWCVVGSCEFKHNAYGVYGGYDSFEITLEGNVSERAHLLTYQGDSPSLWLAPGDLAQTYYDAPIYKAYLFGVFNRVHLGADDVSPPDLYNGLMEGVPIYAALGNHGWNVPPAGVCSFTTTLPDSDKISCTPISATEWNCHSNDKEYCDQNGYHWIWLGGRASEQMWNLFPPHRRFEEERNNKFKYNRSSYSFDFGNMHIISMDVEDNGSCDFRYDDDNPYDENTNFDKDCFLAPWDPGNDEDAYRENGKYDELSDSEQFIWLKRDLWKYKDDKDIWKIVIFHVPMYGKDDNIDQPQGSFSIRNHMHDDTRRKIARFFELEDVDIIITGHDHWYHRMSTEPISERFGVPPDLPNTNIPDEQHSTHLVAGTGGYNDAEGASEQIGVPRLFVDGNMLYLVWHDAKPNYVPNGNLYEPHEDNCLFVKGVPGINKSDCLNPWQFPSTICNGTEGKLCGYVDEDLGHFITGRCLIPHTNRVDVIGQAGPSSFRWGNTLRCIPLPASFHLNDSDGDGAPDSFDNCMDISNPGQQDEDHDGVGDVCDNCKYASNPKQEDCDEDGIGDACDPIENGMPLTATPPEMLFPFGNPGTEQSSWVLVQNTSDYAVQVAAVSLIGSDFELDTGPIICPVGQPCYPSCGSLPNLEPEGYCTENIIYVSPGGPTVFGKLIVTADLVDPCSNGVFSLLLPLIGTGKHFGGIHEYKTTITPSTIDFGDVNVGTSAAARIFEVTNTGDLGQLVTIVNPDTQYYGVWMVPDTQCERVQYLDPGESCEYMVHFVPDSVGLFQDQIRVQSQDPDAPDIVQLLGHGVQ